MQTKTAPKGVPPINKLISNHEYILCYSRNNFSFNGIIRSDKGFSNPDNDSRGPWKADNMKSTVITAKEFAIVDPDTGNIFSKTWGFSEATLNKMIKEGKVLFPSDSSGTPRQKKFLSEYKDKNIPITSYLSVYHTETATNKLKKLFDDKKIMDFPKSVDLMHFLVQQSTQNGDIVLDFFAGSCTTAHAVMQLNAEDGGKRRYIMVQLPEPTPKNSEAHKAGYKTIADIGRERIRRAASKIKEEYSNKDLAKDAPNLDLGFKSFHLDESNFKIWDESISSVTQLQKQLEDHLEPILQGRGEEDILYEVMLKNIYPLTSRVEIRSLANYSYYRISPPTGKRKREARELILCLTKKATKHFLEALEESDTTASTIIMLDSAFNHNPSLFTNFYYRIRSKAKRERRTIRFIGL